ncbi:MAG: LysM peptidoglycan-binding domain-containing protein [Acidobacteria bacterium]|nr:LysM peptidoglycan-binding domain-containing protein [Acidobacteriota bacterium]
MALTDKYQSLIDMARAHGNISIEDRGDVLAVSGTVNGEAAKQSIWEEYARLDPDMGSGDLLLDLQVVEGGGDEVYEVKPGDSLSKIATHYEGVSWREIFEANRDQLDDPDKIFPGQKLRIPKG